VDPLVEVISGSAHTKKGMSVAVQVVFLTVVARAASLAQLDGEALTAANELFHWQRDWFRQDPHLMATSLMAPADVRAFGTALETRTPLRRGQDWAVVDALVGLVEPYAWLEFRGGPGEATGVWLKGTHPGELQQIRSLLPSWVLDSRTTGKVLQAFDRDTTWNEDKPHSRKDNLLPSWGGTSLWLMEVEPNGSHGNTSRKGQFVAIEARDLNFVICAPTPVCGPNIPAGRP
jgi:hypothetical protein